MDTAIELLLVHTTLLSAAALETVGGLCIFNYQLLV